ncbi:MAG: 50S ribosomal protein L23 [Candidatus Pacebacteria bacterium]|nr:50S ribosomal protein L23 [Candidatus Paceibacterota bacterium]
MAILDALKKDKKDNTSDTVQEEIVTAEKKVNAKKNVATSLHGVLKHPRITEKAAILAGDGVYTFEIDPKATKIDVARAIKEVYKVEPRKISISKLPAKKKLVRGKRGTTSAVKKALVYLKKGDKIEFV